MADGPIKLTPWGQFVYRHGVLTHHSYWSKLLKEVERLQDEDADWGVLLDERIEGMQELKRRLIEEGGVEYWQDKKISPNPIPPEFEEEHDNAPPSY